jgi:hypothetical protein
MNCPFATAFKFGVGDAVVDKYDGGAQAIRRVQATATNQRGERTYKISFGFMGPEYWVTEDQLNKAPCKD